MLGGAKKSRATITTICKTTADNNAAKAVFLEKWVEEKTSMTGNQMRVKKQTIIIINHFSKKIKPNYPLVGIFITLPKIKSLKAAFVCQQPSLNICPARITPKTVRCHHTMAWDNETDGIFAVGRSDSTVGIGATDFIG